MVISGELHFSVKEKHRKSNQNIFHIRRKREFLREFEKNQEEAKRGLGRNRCCGIAFHC